MQQRLADPRAVYLCSPPQHGAGHRSRMALEQLEAAAPLADVMALLTQRQLAHSPWPGAAALAVEAALRGSNWVGAAGHLLEGGQQAAAPSSPGGWGDGGAAAAPGAAAAGSSKGGGSGSAAERLVVVVKREAGLATVPLWLPPQCSIAGLEHAVEALEGWRPRRLTCFQAPDGCLHVLLGA
jgi:hypothetical protein